MYPNPNEASFVLVQRKGVDGLLPIKVYDALGRVVLNTTVYFAGGKAGIQLPQRFPGQYLLYIGDEAAGNPKIKFTVK